MPNAPRRFRLKFVEFRVFSAIGMGRGMADNRRNFLKKAGGVTALVAAAPLGAALSEPSGSSGAAAASLLGGSSFALEIEGRSAGALVWSEGGTAVAAVVEEPTIPNQFTKKHLGAIRYEPIQLQASIGLNRELLDWIIESLTPGKPALKDGTIKVADFTGNVVEERNFFNALLSEIGFPAMDGASRDPAPLEIRILPESTASAPGSGGLPSPPRESTWIASNFRFSLGNLPASRVSRIEPFKITVEALGGGAAGVAVRVPDLRVTFSAVDAGPWQAFFNDFVLNGNNGPANELTGRLELLSADLKEVIMALELRQVGIFGLARVTSADSAIQRFAADLYVEQMALVAR